MKTNKILSAFCLLLGISTTYAALPQLISCQNVATDKKIEQCNFRVAGQIIHQPKSISTLYGFSKLPYALCSSAKCDINRKRNIATCHCKVYGVNDQTDWHSISIGPYPYQASKPLMRNGKLYEVTSNFSHANMQFIKPKKPTTCYFVHRTNWANCFGVACKINMNDSSDNITATCQCPLVKTRHFISTGPTTAKDCQLPENKAWSAASKAQGTNDFSVIRVMYKKYYPSRYFEK